VLVKPPHPKEFEKAVEMDDALRASETMFAEDDVLVSAPEHSAIADMGWTSFKDLAAIDALVESLNPRGFREGPLKKNLEIHRDILVRLVKRSPAPKVRKPDDAAEMLCLQAESDMSQLEFKLYDGMLVVPEYDEATREAFGAKLVAAKTPQEYVPSYLTSTTPWSPVVHAVTPHRKQ
jgi:hypothetical protein